EGGTAGVPIRRMGPAGPSVPLVASPPPPETGEHDRRSYLPETSSTLGRACGSRIVHDRERGRPRPARHPRPSSPNPQAVRNCASGPAPPTSPLTLAFGARPAGVVAGGRVSPRLSSPAFYRPETRR